MQIDEKVTNEILIFDDQRIRSIIQNLVFNAIKFSSPGGKIDIRASFSDVMTKTELILSVADTGFGMTDEIKESVFTMFRSLTRQPNQIDEN